MSIVLWVFQVVGRSRTLYFLAENVPLSSILLSHEPLFRITMSLNSVPHSIVCHFLAIFSVTCSRRSSHWSEGDDQLSKTHMDGKGSQNHSARFSDRGYNFWNSKNPFARVRRPGYERTPSVRTHRRSFSVHRQEKHRQMRLFRIGGRA